MQTQTNSEEEVFEILKRICNLVEIPWNYQLKDSELKIKEIANEN
jgi:hypothetical protein